MPAFCFIDEVAEVVQNERITAFFTLKGDEEFLEDHFKGFPVMPGVLMLEALVQAASRLLAASKAEPDPRFRLVKVEEVRFGRFVKPGSRVQIDAKILKSENGQVTLEGKLDLPGSVKGRTLTANIVLEAVA